MQEYVVPSLAVLEDQTFNSLSLTAQQWVPVKEVSIYDFYHCHGLYLYFVEMHFIFNYNFKKYYLGLWLIIIEIMEQERASINIFYLGLTG